MATFYILMEDGNRFLTEDGNDLLIQEQSNGATLEEGQKQFRDSRRRCIIATLVGSLAWILI